MMKEHNEMWEEIFNNRIRKIINRNSYTMDNLSDNLPSTPVVNTIKRNDFVIEFFPNENVVEIHTKFIVSSHDLIWTPVESPSEEKMNSELLNLIREIEVIPGILRMHSVEKYSIAVIKGKAFDWDDILPHIEQKLIDYQK